MSILVLQSSWWGRESWLLCLFCPPGVSWWLSVSSSRCHGVVCGLWLWYFLIILTYYFVSVHELTVYLFNRWHVAIEGLAVITPDGQQSKTLLTIDERWSKIARNSVFDCYLSPVGWQMAIENSVSKIFDLGLSIELTFSIATFLLPVVMDATMCRLQKWAQCGIHLEY